MSDHEQEIRSLVCNHLESFRYNFTRTAIQDGFLLGYAELQMADAILDHLRSDCRINRLHLGEPPDPDHVTYTVNNVDGNRIYVKFVLEIHNLYIMSFKKSIHS